MDSHPALIERPNHRQGCFSSMADFARWPARNPQRRVKRLLSLRAAREKVTFGQAGELSKIERPSIKQLVSPASTASSQEPRRPCAAPPRPSAAPDAAAALQAPEAAAPAGRAPPQAKLKDSRPTARRLPRSIDVGQPLEREPQSMSRCSIFCRRPSTWTMRAAECLWGPTRAPHWAVRRRRRAWVGHALASKGRREAYTLSGRGRQGEPSRLAMAWSDMAGR
jgi:hypothetical protein